MNGTIRRLHNYLGLIIAPSVLFFALTGALQLFNLHETHGGYRAPALLIQLSSIHKDQSLKRSESVTPADSGSQTLHSETVPLASDRPTITTVILKWFFLIVALGLTLSTSLGLWIGLARRKRLAWILLGAGAALPALLTLGLALGA